MTVQTFLLVVNHPCGGNIFHESVCLSFLYVYRTISIGTQPKRAQCSKTKPLVTNRKPWSIFAISGRPKHALVMDAAESAETLAGGGTGVIKIAPMCDHHLGTPFILYSLSLSTRLLPSYLIPLRLYSFARIRARMKYFSMAGMCEHKALYIYMHTLHTGGEYMCSSEYIIRIRLCVLALFMRVFLINITHAQSARD